MSGVSNSGFFSFLSVNGVTGTGQPAITGVVASPTTFNVPGSYSGTLAATCSATCPGGATFTLDTTAGHCAQTNSTGIAVSGTTITLPVETAAGSYYACVDPNMTGVTNSGSPQLVTITGAGVISTVTINGTSTGVQVGSGSRLTVAVANGPGNALDRIAICNSSTPSSANCDGAGYNWAYLQSCNQTPPSSGITSNTCSLTAPSVAGSYFVVLILVSGSNYIAEGSAPFTVAAPTIANVTVSPTSCSITAPASTCSFSGALAAVCNVTPCPGTPTFMLAAPSGTGTISIVQSPSLAIPGFFNPTTTCSMTANPIGTGNTVVGFMHSTPGATLTSVVDNAGHTYTVSAGTAWLPYGELIEIWYLANISGNPTTFTFTFASNVNFCNAGLVEYAGAGGINAVVNPVSNASGPDPSITITPTTNSAIWAFGAPNTPCPFQSASDPPGGISGIENAGYSLLINNCSNDGVGVWGSNSTATSGVPQTLTWSNHEFWNASMCADGTTTTTGCSVVMAAVAVSGTITGGPKPTVTVNGAASGATVSAGASMTVAVANGPGNPTDWMGICNTATSPGSAQCDGIGYSWDYLNCQRTVPSGNPTSGSCSLTAPTVAGTYYANFMATTNTSPYPLYASAQFTVTGTGPPSVCTSSVGGPSPTPCPTGLAAPAGFQWNLTFDDEFTQDSSLNTSLWTNTSFGQGRTVCCDPVLGAQTYAGLQSNTQGSGGFGQPPSGGQVFGFWEVSMKLPTDVNGEGDGRQEDVFLTVGGGSSTTTQQDYNDKIYGTNDRTNTYAFFENGSNAGSIRTTYGASDGSALDQAFHVNGEYWANDGSGATSTLFPSGQGSIRYFYDGTPFFGPNALSTANSNLANGYVFGFLDVGCFPAPVWSGTVCGANSSPSTNPLNIKYARRWQLVPTATVSVNGSTTGTTVSAGASMTVAVTGDPGNIGDQPSICTPVPTSWSQCGGAGYDWKWNNCLQTAPASGKASWSCPYTAPPVAGNYVVALLLNGSVNTIATQTPFTVTGGGGGGACTTSVATSSPVPCPLGVSPPAGQVWNLVYDDEFTQDSALRSEWTCSSSQQCAAVSLNSTNGLVLQPYVVATGNTAVPGSVAAIAGGPQTRFGYFEWNAKLHTDASGEGDGYHSDFYITNNNGSGFSYNAKDVCEKVYGIPNIARCDTWSPVNGSFISYPSSYCCDLGAAFHTYGNWWNNDGTGTAGSSQVFFDGAVQTGMLTMDRNDVGTQFGPGYGYTILLTQCCWNTAGWDGGSIYNPNTTSLNNPLYIKYMRVWQLADTTGGGGGGTCTSSIASPAVCPVGGPAPPSGQHWNLVLEDDFGSFNSSIWGGGASTPQQSGNATLTFGSTGAALQGLGENCSPGTCNIDIIRAALSSYAPSNPACCTPFGYWEWDAKYPTFDGAQYNGYHTDIWFRAHASDGVSSTTNEIDVCEQEPGANGFGGTAGQNTGCNMFINGPSVADWMDVGADMGAAFHKIGFYWNNDGTAQGSVSSWIDGTQRSGTHALTAPWNFGAIMIQTEDTCFYSTNTIGCPSQDHNPLLLHYVRHWQLAPN